MQSSWSLCTWRWNSWLHQNRRLSFKKWQNGSVYFDWSAIAVSFTKWQTASAEVEKYTADCSEAGDSLLKIADCISLPWGETKCLPRSYWRDSLSAILLHFLTRYFNSLFSNETRYSWKNAVFLHAIIL